MSWSLALSSSGSAVDAVLSSTLSRIVRAVLWRIYHETEHLILSAPTLSEAPPTPPGYRLVRIQSGDVPGAALIRTAMQASGETDDPLERLAQGHECFAWERNGVLVAYGWVCFQNRSFGGKRLLDREGRAFCFQFHTAPEQRGQGLYTSLLLNIRHELGTQGWRELFIDVRVDNEPSRRGIARAGFLPVMQTVVGTWFCRYQRWARHTALRSDIPVVA